MRLTKQLRSGKVNHPLRDCIAGIVVALVSIPIGIGYAQIAGLPAIYGLYGSLLPIFVFGFLTTSPLFVIGVDAMPAVMTGVCLGELGITPGSEEAMHAVPLMAILVACWFVVFRLFHAGRVVKYISTPVMGGFISGVGVTIILMQIPKLFGGSAGTGELLSLLVHIKEELPKFNPVSFGLSIITIGVILVCKKLKPKLPMTVIMMGVGALLQAILGLDKYGVALLPTLSRGLPKLIVPDISMIWPHTLDFLLESASIAAVIMAQTLLSTGNYAMKYGDETDADAELIAYAGMNLAAGLVGSCAVNGSVSRSGIADSFGARSQLLSVAAALTMLLVLLFGTPFLSILPVPVLTAIVVTALIGIVDYKLFLRLWNSSRNEWLIFVLSFVGVLVLGTVNGVLVGCMLSFAEVAVRAVAPPCEFIGRIPGHGNYHSLTRNSHARPICNTVIYRFSGNLFFANIDRFEKDIKQAVKSDTKLVVVDARGIGSIDVTAVDRLLLLRKYLQDRNIRFYITEHASSLNDQLRILGGAALINEGAVRRTISLALRDAGLEKPYKLEGIGDDNVMDVHLVSDERLAEFEWAFGSDAEKKMEELAGDLALSMVQSVEEHEESLAALEAHGATTKWGMVGLFDEQELWDHLEARLEILVRDGVIPVEEAEWIETRIEKRRAEGIARLGELSPKAIELMNKHRANVLKHFKETDPAGYEHLRKIKSKLEGKEDKTGK